MPITQKIDTYLEKLEELKSLEQEIVEILPPQLWDRYQKLQLEIPSDKSVLQKEIKEGKTTIDHAGLSFKVSTRNRSTISPNFLSTARDLGHVDTLIDLGVITGIKINEDQIERLDPELAGIYGNLVSKTPTLALSWPKRADK